MSSGSGPSWRGSAGSARGAGGARSWRKPGSGPAQTWPVRSRWVRGFLSLFSAAIGLGAIALFVFLIFVPGCTQTRYSILAPAPYNDAGLPPHPFAQQDREAFREKFGAAGLSEVLAGKPGSTAGQPARAASSRGVQFLYVTALAGETATGVVLYSIDSGPDEIEGAIPLTRVWDYLASLPKEQRKILAIDIARGPIDWRWGLFLRPSIGLSDDVGTASAAVHSEKIPPIPNLAVLTSAAPGEVSWTTPGLGQSVFGHFLIRALAGEADGSGGQPRDFRVTLAELDDYVRTHTHHWVSQNRDLRGQHPRLLVASGSREAMLATVVGEVRAKAVPPRLEAPRAIEGTTLRQLEAVWEARDKWAAREPEQWQPILWRQLQEHLRRAEQWRLAGQPEGMEPHLLAAEKAVRDLEEAEASRRPDLGAFRFVAASLARGATPEAPAGPVPETEPPLAERQMRAVFGSFAPTGLPKSVMDAAAQQRLEAENASWHSYRSRLWTGTAITDIDRDRRMAEDLLFVGGTEELERSSASRNAAGTALRRHQETVRVLAEAHRLHSRLLAELPDMAWWAAQRLPIENTQAGSAETRRSLLMNAYSQGIDESRFRPPSLTDQKEEFRDEPDDTSLQQTEIDLLLLFEETRQLARLLNHELERDGAFTGPEGTTWLEEIKALVPSLNDPERGIGALQGRLSRHAQGLIGSAASDTATRPQAGIEQGQAQYFHWLRLRNALQWSGLSAETRRGLFADLEQSDRILQVNAQKVPVGAAAEWNGDDRTGVDGCWQSLWALQSLSLGADDAAMHERWVTWKNAVVDPRKQVALLTQLGEGVRRELRERVDRAQPVPASSDSMPAVLRTLVRAEHAGRTLHGDDACLFSIERDPVRRRRDFDLGALCVLQAERYIEDFWGTVKPSDREPWYVQAAEQCLRAAGRQSDRLSLAPLKRAIDDAAARLAARQTARLRIVPPKGVVDLGLVAQRDAQIATEANEQIPPGVFSLWLQEPAQDERANGAAKLAFVPTGRRPVTASAPEVGFSIRKERAAAASECATIGIRPRLLFRGRFWDEQDDLLMVDPCPPDSIEEQYRPPSPFGQIVVSGADRRDTLLMLDCSLSMAEKFKGNETRFQVGKRALIEAIQALHSGPALRDEKEPHIVGFMAYGHRARARKDPTQTDVNLDWTDPVPGTITAGDGWKNDFEIFVRPGRLVGDQYDRIMKQIQRLQPYGNTPLLGSILLAAQSLIDQKRGGVIVAICDGSFNDEYRDKDNPGVRYQAVRELLSNHKELSLHIVAFGVEQQDDIEALSTLAAEANGKFHEAPTGAKLAETIEKVMKARPYEVARRSPPGEAVSRELKVPVEKLSPGRYEVTFPGLGPFPARIDGGERLELDLDFPGLRLVQRRPPPQLFTRVRDTSPLGPAEPTRFGYLKANLDREKGTASLELSLDRDDRLGMIDRPAEIRIEVVPQGTTAPLSRLWRLAPDQSIPVWQMELRNWPVEKMPEVRASWKMTRTEPDQQWPLGIAVKEPQRVTIPDWPEGSLTMTAEHQPGRVLVKLQANDGAGEGNIADVRVELGSRSQVESRFRPGEFGWKSRFYRMQRQIIYDFEIGDAFEPADARIAVTSRTSLDREARTLESPLFIEKWDKEQ